MRRSTLSLLLLAATSAHAVVIRHDVDDAAYRVPETELAALVDMPHEGHGVLITPQWIVTAAHTTQWHPVTEVKLHGECRKVAQVVVHPGYKALPAELQTGDVGRVMAFLAGSDDIALIKLAEPATDVTPVALYRASDERGKPVKLVGKGGTGDGREGQKSPNRTLLRRAFNTVSNAEGRWVDYVFDTGAAAVPLEGMGGNGDSGSPLLVDVGGQWQLAGLAAWKYQDVQGKAADTRAGVYGQTSKNVRISHYADWIGSVMATDAARSANQPAAGERK
jgi:hypothetical protein